MGAETDRSAIAATVARRRDRAAHVGGGPTDGQESGNRERATRPRRLFGRLGSTLDSPGIRHERGAEHGPECAAGGGARADARLRSRGRPLACRWFVPSP